MGASSWKYFTPFKENPQEALDILRQQEFQAGRFYKPGADLPETYEEWVKDLNIPQDQIETFKNSFDILKANSKIIPETIDQLFELNQESGTHSILDIFEISETTDLDESGKLDSNELLKLFGTERPTRKMIEDKEFELYDFRGRFLCTYIVVYKDDIPDELYFTGFSGD